LVSVDRLDVRSGGHQSTGVGVATYALACVSHVLHEEVHQWNLIRRDFIVLSGSSLTASSIGALGFGAAADAQAAAVREFKLSHATETRNTCTYCSAGCGILIYSLGDRAKNVKPLIMRIEGDPDHPVNRGTLCPKGSALLDVVHAPTRLKYPMYRAPGSAQFNKVSWEFALDPYCAVDEAGPRHQFIAKNANAVTVNRWISTGMLAASASTTETAYLTWKVARSLGMVVFDNQARV
jgi:formate dehydrogenase major subunit